MFPISEKLYQKFMELKAPPAVGIVITPEELRAILGYLSLRLYEFVRVHECIMKSANETELVTDRDTVARWVVATVLEEAGLNDEESYLDNSEWLWQVIKDLISEMGYQIETSPASGQGIMTNGVWHSNFVITIRKSTN